ncbi:MAG: HAD family hydrolase [Cyanobacteria bacterium P01_A01_bin.84]
MIEALKTKKDEDGDTSISEVLNLIDKAPDSVPVLIDFDETLFLRNSTEEYLNSLQPRILGYLFLTLLSFLKPWNFLPSSLKGDVSRDWMRVLLATIFFPWTIVLWQFQAKKLAQTHGNTILMEAIAKKTKTQIVISSLGFDFIIRAIAKHLPIKIDKIVACRFWGGGKDRSQGKLATITKALGKDVVESSMVITDSHHDLPLLNSSSIPCLFVWSEAKSVPAMDDVYIPFFYLEKVKKPGKPYFLYEIVAYDLLFLLIGLTWLSPQPIFHVVSMIFLLLSFWCIYEIGYMENDLVAEKFEKKPVLSERYQRYKSRISLWKPWIWSGFFAIPGIIFLELSKESVNQLIPTLSNLTFSWEFNVNFLITHRANILTTASCWLGLLVFVRVLFWVYNHIDKYTRVWLYPILQACRCFGFLSVATTNTVGAMIFAAYVISRWLPYIVYRYAKTNDYPKEIGPLSYIFIFALLIIAAANAAQDISIVINWQAFIIISYCVYRVRNFLFEVIRSIHPVWEDQWDTVNLNGK